MAETTFTVRVRPGTSRTSVGGSYGDQPALIVAVTAPAVDGRANDAVITALSDAFGMRPRDIRIVSGQASRSKVVAIECVDAEAMQARLLTLLGRH